MSAAPAAAHGISSKVAGKSPVEFVPIGMEHMLLGWDHLLFIVSVVLLAGRLKRASKLITVFVVGHSTTLISATLAGWRVSPEWVDVVIALSIVYVGAVGRCGPPREPRHWRWFGAGVLGFGFVHGLGLSTRLQDLGLPQDGLLPRVIAFNVGLEIGQLLAITSIVGLGRLVFLAMGRLRRPATGRAANVGLAAVGAMAAIVLADKAIAGVDSYEQMLTTTSGLCTVKKEAASPSAVGPRLEQAFFGPSETIPADGVAALVADGGVAIRYRPDLPRSEWEQLESLVDNLERTAAGPAPDQRAVVVAVTRSRVLDCEAVDIEALAAFRELWFGELNDTVQK